MRVAEHMMPVVITCHVDDSLDHAARLLWDRDCGCLAVVDLHGRLRGMLTDRDICMAAHITGQRLQDLQVREAMAIDVVTTGPEETTRSAELLMREHRVRRLPVVDDRGHVVGMLTCNDLIRWVDDAGTTHRSHHDSVHLIRTLAFIGAARPSHFASIYAPPSPLRSAGPPAPFVAAPTQQSLRDSIHAAVVARAR
jgi:CBS domain-containing protein